MEVFLPSALAGHGELPPGQSPVQRTRGQPGHGRRPVPGHRAALPAGVSQLRPGRCGREGRGCGAGSARPRSRSPPANALVSSVPWRRRSPACREPTAATTRGSCCSRPASCSAAGSAAPPAGYSSPNPCFGLTMVSVGKRRLQQPCLATHYLSLGTLGVEAPRAMNGDSFFPLCRLKRVSPCCWKFSRTRLFKKTPKSGTSCEPTSFSWWPCT